MSQYLQEAFKAFTLLEGEEFDLTDSGVEAVLEQLGNASARSSI